MAIKWSDDQQAVFNFVETGRGSAVVEAVAGAGKTTTLVEAVRRMSGSVFLGAFNTKMAAELATRTADLPKAKASTFHSAGNGALLRFLGKGKFEVDAKKVQKIVAAQLQGGDYEDWEATVAALVSKVKQRGFYVQGLIPTPRSSDYLELINRHDLLDKLPEDADVRVLIKFAHAALVASNEDRTVIDFDDMIYLPLLLNLRMFQNDWVLIDEAQDTNPTRRLLAKKMLRPGGRLIAVGDPHQAIFGFTGADSDSLELIKADFQAQTLKLSVSYRCPRSVIKLAREYVSHIVPAPAAPEGECRDMPLDDMHLIAQPGDAILCRYNRYLVDACFRLIRAGKPAKIEGKDIGEQLVKLAGKWKVKALMALADRLTRYEDKEIEKAKAKDDDARIERIQDTCATLRVLIERGQEQGITSVSGLQEMIRSMFGDVGNSKALIVLSSVHKAKGLEWPRVFILGRRQYMPSRMAKQAWQVEQEINLCYVAVTRAQETLIDVDMPPEKAARRAEAA